jgi:hypothetical protein
MTLATRDQLNQAVDDQFYGEHPDAPRPRLDPDNPTHAEYVRQWIEIRDRTVNSWTDAYFYEFFPSAGKLDPSNQADGQLIEYWNDIKQQILGEQGRYSWDSPPPAPLEVVEVQPDGDRRGFVLTFNRATTIDEAERYLWGGPPPTGGGIEHRSDTQMRVELTIDALRNTREDVARRVSETGVLTAD